MQKGSKGLLAVGGLAVVGLITLLRKPKPRNVSLRVDQRNGQIRYVAIVENNTPKPITMVEYRYIINGEPKYWGTGAFEIRTLQPGESFENVWGWIDPFGPPYPLQPGRNTASIELRDSMGKVHRSKTVIFWIA